MNSTQQTAAKVAGATVAVALAGALAVSTLTPATYTVSGDVHTGTVPVANAPTTLRDPASGAVLATVASAADGSISLNGNAPPGDYVLETPAQDGGTVSVPIHLAGGGTPAAPETFAGVELWTGNAPAPPPPPPPPADTRPALTGVVTIAGQTDQSGTTVTARHATTLAVLGSAKTTPAGVWRLPGATPGVTYEVRVTRPGWASSPFQAYLKMPTSGDGLVKPFALSPLP
jgi:hypothetical protein